MTDLVQTTLDRGVLLVEMKRINKKNALTSEMYEVMADALDRADNDRDVKVVLFTGSEGVFTAGNDLAVFLQNPPLGEEVPVNRFIAGLLNTDAPLVAAVEGYAVGIGTTMLLHCEQVFANPGTTFSLPFINLAVVPEAASSMLLAESCGYQKAAELLMLGEPFDGEEALRCGIVSQLCEPGETLDRAMEAALRFAAKPRDALRATKRLMRRPQESMADRAREEMAVFAEALASPTAREAITAVLEKRPPNFEGLS